MATTTGKDTPAGHDADTNADTQVSDKSGNEQPEISTASDHPEATDNTDTPGSSDDDDPSKSGDTHQRRWLKPPRLRRRALLPAALSIAALAGLAGLGSIVWQQRQIVRASHDAQQTAITYAQTLTSIDSSKIDDNFTAVLNGATGDFKDMYTQASVQLRQLLLDNKASAHGVVVDSAVQSATTDKVVVLLFVDQTVTNTNVPDPRIDRSRVKMTMTNVDGSWRASKVELP
jgi:Mce-associated membrane protein